MRIPQLNEDYNNQQGNLMPSDAVVLFAVFSWASNRWAHHYYSNHHDEAMEKNFHEECSLEFLCQFIPGCMQWIMMTICAGDGGGGNHNCAHKLFHTLRVTLLLLSTSYTFNKGFITTLFSGFIHLDSLRTKTCFSNLFNKLAKNSDGCSGEFRCLVEAQDQMSLLAARGSRCFHNLVGKWKRIWNRSFSSLCLVILTQMKCRWCLFGKSNFLSWFQRGARGKNCYLSYQE